MIYLISTLHDEKRRQAARHAYGKNRPAFVVGGGEDTAPNLQGDLLFVPCPDDAGYAAAKLRLLCSMVEGPLFVGNADTFVEPNRLLALRETSGHAGLAGGLWLTNEARATLAARLLTANRPDSPLASRVDMALAEAGLKIHPDERMRDRFDDWPRADNDVISCGGVWTGQRVAILHALQNVCRLPKLLHHIWLGDRPMPQEQQAWITSWTRLNPGWEDRLWTDKDVAGLEMVCRDQFERATHPAQRSDILRLEILRQFGGLYRDTDFQCLKPVEPLLSGLDFFCGNEQPGVVGTALLGCTPGHAVIETALQILRETFDPAALINMATGPGLMMRALARHPDVPRMPVRMLYPYHLQQKQELSHVSDWAREFPHAYAVHHWSASWIS